MRKFLLAGVATVALAGLAGLSTQPANASDWNINVVAAVQGVGVGPQTSNALASAYSSADKATSDATALNVGNVLSADLSTKGDGILGNGVLGGQFAGIASQAASASSYASSHGAASATAAADNIGNALSVTSSIVGK